MAFTDREKAQIRHHLGYASWGSMASGIQLGFPAGIEPMTLLEQAFGRLLPEGEEIVRFDLCQCNSAEAAIGDSRRRMAYESVDKVRLAQNEADKLARELKRWQLKLADDLGCFPNPYDLSHNAAGGINAKVSH